MWEPFSGARLACREQVVCKHWNLDRLHHAKTSSYSREIKTTVNVLTLIQPGAFLLTWINLNCSMDRWSHAQLRVGWNYLFIPKLQRLHRWSLRMGKWFHSTLYDGWNYFSPLWLELLHGPCSPFLCPMKYKHDIISFYIVVVILLVTAD